jgi:hypothetical protein
VRVLVWIPSRPTEVMKPVWRTVAWAQELDVEGASFDPYDFHWPQRKHEVLVVGDVKSTSLSMARSAAIAMAKSCEANLIMVDADTAPRGNVGPMLSVMSQGFRQGYGAIISPAVSESRTVGVLSPRKAPSGEYYAFDNLAQIPVGLFEIGAGTGGFIAVSKECLHKWEKVGEFKWKGDSEHEARLLPMYYRWEETAGQSEDYAMLAHIRDAIGMKIGADTRFKTLHTKTFGIPSYEGPGDGIGQQG